MSFSGHRNTIAHEEGRSVSRFVKQLAANQRSDEPNYTDMDGNRERQERLGTPSESVLGFAGAPVPIMSPCL